MSALEVVQSRVRDALVRGDAAALEPSLTGAPRPLARLAIHQRHFLASLTRVVVERFPATAWLVGSDLVTVAAQAFVRAHPPSRPCVAEYGELFPAFLAAHPGAVQLPYLGDFARLEWHLGRLALAIEIEPAATLPTLANGRSTAQHPRLQASVAYLHLRWSVDELLSVFLLDTQPEAFALRSENVWLQVRGNRGTLQMQRLLPGEFAFRSSLAAGTAIDEASGRARGVDAWFNVDARLAALHAEGLVTDFLPPAAGS